MSHRSKALLLTAGIAGAVMLLPSVFRKRRDARAEDDEVYDDLQQPKWAPPTWAFPVAWTASSVALAATAAHLILRPGHRRRTELLTYLGLHTALYATFSRVYFDERSPFLAAAWTTADFAVCHLAFYRALGVNGKAAAGFVPVNLWLTLATPLGLYQAAANPDPKFGGLGAELGEVIAGAAGVPPIGRHYVRTPAANAAGVSLASATAVDGGRAGADAS